MAVSPHGFVLDEKYYQPRLATTQTLVEPTASGVRITILISLLTRAVGGALSPTKLSIKPEPFKVSKNGKQGISKLTIDWPELPNRQGSANVDPMRTTTNEEEPY